MGVIDWLPSGTSAIPYQMSARDGMSRDYFLAVESRECSLIVLDISDRSEMVGLVVWHINYVQSHMTLLKPHEAGL